MRTVRALLCLCVGCGHTSTWVDSEGNYHAPDATEEERAAPDTTEEERAAKRARVAAGFAAFGRALGQQCYVTLSSIDRRERA